MVNFAQPTKRAVTFALPTVWLFTPTLTMESKTELRQAGIRLNDPSGKIMRTFIIQAVIWSLCAGTIWFSYWNYSRYVDAKRNPEMAKRSQKIALHAMNHVGIGIAEFKQIESSHYRPYQKRFRITLFVGFILGVVGLAHLLV